MKIGLILERFEPGRGGLEQWSWQFAAGMAARGHQVHALAGSFSESVRRLPIATHQLRATRSRLDFGRAAEEAARGLDLDIIHDTGAGWYCDVFQPHGGSRTAAIEQNVQLLPRYMRPVKRTAAKVLPRYREFAALMKRQYVDDGRVFLALSNRVADDFRRLHGVRPERIRVIPNGVDTDRFSPQHRQHHRRAVRHRLGVDDSTLLLLIVAHSFRLKGVPSLIKSVSRLNASGRSVHLAVVGGKRLRAYRRKAALLGIGSRVTFVGAVDSAVPFYAAADVYVQPTFYDPCSLVVLEAMASGLPVITSRQNGVGELIGNNVEGGVIDDPASVHELLDRLQPMFEPSVRRRMGQAARRTALQCTTDRNWSRIEAVYDEIIQSRRRRFFLTVTDFGGAIAGPRRTLVPKLQLGNRQTKTPDPF